LRAPLNSMLGARSRYDLGFTLKDERSTRVHSWRRNEWKATIQNM